MKRLPEQFEVASPNEDVATALLKHVPPLEPSAIRKRRVWMAIERSGAMRTRSRVSAPILVAVVLVGATAASATMPHIWKRLMPAAVETTETQETSHAAQSTRSARRTPPAAPAAPMPGPVLEPVVPEPITAAPAAEPAPVVRKSAPVKAHAPAVEAVDPPASAALMVEAMRERRAGNWVRARELASEYRAKYPGGALTEEALALSIEASASLGDDEAKKLSTLYLQRFPRGRFRAQAQRVLGSSR